jgi:two-component system OmpR family sensor kinase
MPITALRRVPIRWRLALWYTLFLVTTLAAVDVFLLAGLEDNLAREVDEALRLRALHIESRLGVGDDGRLDPGDVAAGLLELTPLEEFSAPGLYVQVRDDQGAVLGSSPNLPAGQLPLAPDALAQALAGRAAYADVSTGAERLRLLAWPVLQGERVVGVVLVGESRHLVDVTLRATRRLLLLAAAGAALASLVGGWWLTGRALGPVAEVTRVARRIAATGQFEQRSGS